MLLTDRSVCHYLLARRLVSPTTIVDGPFAVVDVSRRNRNYKVLLGPGRGLFLKQIQHFDPQTIATLQCEAACYWLARQDPVFAGLAGLTPECLWYDLDRHVLITSLVPDSENVRERRRRGAASAEVDRALGRQLGAYHRHLAHEPTDPRHGAIFPRQIPWILCADRRNSHPFKNLTAATSVLFDELERFGDVELALEQIGREWRIETLIHGDLRFENCVLPVRPAGDVPLVTIVDWEMADIGDRRWDVAGVLQAYVCEAVFAGHTLEDAANDAQAFWQAYLSARAVDEESSAALIAECLQYAAARMIQSAYEQAQFSAVVSRESLQLLDVSAGILRQPDAAAALLGA